MAGYQLGLI